MDFRVGGIKCKINKFFVLFLVLTAIYGRLFEVFIFFLSIMFHELGHVMAARAFGLTVNEIELMPFGGVARISSLGYTSSHEEVIIILAGPLVNIAVACMLICARIAGFEPGCAGFVIDFNAGLAGFNLLPAWPLDGGRLLRIFLDTKLGFFKAKNFVLWTGRILSAGLIFSGVMLVDAAELSAFYSLAAGFIFISGFRKDDYIFYRIYKTSGHKLSKMVKGAIFPAEVLVVHETAQIASVLNRLVPGKYALVYVIDKDGKAVACLTETKILNKVSENGYYATFKSLLER